MNMALSHIDKQGRAVMVDVSAKKIVRRTAVASGLITMQPDTVRLVAESALEKGDVIACARLAGITAAKKTAELIPLCHNLPLDHISVECSLKDDGVGIEASVSCAGRTGVEMEALTAAAVAALTIYDMCKAVDKNMVIGGIKLIEKRKEPLT
ncbi:MAG: cyclic pyranopterin monophosphate synthase MoaC [Chitinispirillaceae bacterium]|nr:cyclic pyranopterin monophosphate synthase MoaC [Chitinispirillaceae bacterium]